MQYGSLEHLLFFFLPGFKTKAKAEAAKRTREARGEEKPGGRLDAGLAQVLAQLPAGPARGTDLVSHGRHLLCGHGGLPAQLPFHNLHHHVRGLRVLQRLEVGWRKEVTPLLTS